uniref:Acetyl-coenzyme A carboxylase carboxyl transferase subunit beta, chloroplastic n=1 Tax=Onobrychis viciifolia TaxID=3882 RepID=A0A7T8ZSR9_ONOVI|nr:AccD [Onobrychis viciifolia]QQQ88426.1 AccD [Onobrychis viciifolia]
MEKQWFNSILFNRELEYRCGLSKSLDGFGPIENTGVSEDLPILTDGVRNIRNFIPDKKTFLVKVTDSKGEIFSIDFSIENHILEIDNDQSFLTEPEPESFFSSYNNSSCLKNDSKNNDDDYMDDTKSNWNNNINSYIESYLRSRICIESSILDDSDEYNDSEFNSYVCSTVRNSGESKSTSLITSTNDSDFTKRESDYDYDPISDYDSEKDIGPPDPYAHLWVLCDFEGCYKLNYKKYFLKRFNICEFCEAHLKMSCSDRIQVLIDPGTWNPMDEDMVSLDPIGWDSMDRQKMNSMIKAIEASLDEDIDASVDEEDEEIDASVDEDIDASVDEEDEDIVSSLDEDIDASVDKEKKMDKEKLISMIEAINASIDELEAAQAASRVSPDPLEWDWEEDPYLNRLPAYEENTGLKEAVQTGTGQLNGIPVAIAIMEFDYMGGSMGSVVGEKITRLIEYATNQRLPLIIICASGGARMQEGSFSLMQMAKISSALYNYQINQKLFYVPILTSPTTGGVTASFGMLGDVIIAEPNAYIAFAGKRVIEQTLNIEVPEGSQSAELLFYSGLVDSIVPRHLLKEVLTELFKFHGFFPLTQNEK